MPATGTTEPSAAAPQVMPCMEVWGGNQAVDCGVIMPGLDAWLYSRPYQGEAGGGDVHYVSSCATGRITRLLLADVSGHGAEVAETGSKLRLLMRRYVNHLDQTKFVVALNSEFGALSASGRFATSIVGTFFAPTNYLTLSNAGHPPGLWYRARERQWVILAQSAEREGEPSNVPLGILEGSEYDQHGVQLSVGDLVLFYTDSLTEARHEDGRDLGPEGLLEIVKTIDTSPPGDLIAALLEAISKKAEGNLAADDVTVLLVRPNGLAPRVPFSDRLKAPFRVMAGVIGSLGGTDRPMPWPEWSLPNIGGALFQSLNRRWRGKRKT